jgi:hypothetical protein
MNAKQKDDHSLRAFTATTEFASIMVAKTTKTRLNIGIRKAGTLMPAT